jgi:hypothetical protein
MRKRMSTVFGFHPYGVFEMSAFSTEKRARDSILTVRLTAEQDAMLAEAAEALGLSGKAELVRQAIDAFLTSNKKAAAAARKAAQK